MLQGIIGGTLQRLFWVFHSRLLPYRELCWCDDGVDCQLKIQSEIDIRFGFDAAFWYAMDQSFGIYKFDVTIHDCFIQLEDAR